MRRAALFLCLLAALLTGCGGGRGEESGGKLRVVAAIFPAWDWTREILGDRAGEVELTLLLENGVDLHSYQPTVDDIITISGCDLFIYVGGESDAWVADALAENANPSRRAIGLLDLLGDSARREEPLEGMQEDGEEDTDAYDEHVWLSLKNAAVFCQAIAQALGELDGPGRETYDANARAYLARLEELDRAYQETADTARCISYRPCDILLFADRFPFRYLTEDYGLTCYAAFSGCSADAEASFETVAFLAGKVDELRLPAVLTTESPVPRLAEAVVEATERKDAAILALDSLQSVTGQAIRDGTTYLGVMEDNLSVLRRATR